MTHVTFPEQLSLQVLPEQTKSAWSDLIFASLDGLPNKWAESCRSLCRYMQAEDHHDLFPHLVSFTRKLDHIRGESIEDACPPLARVIAQWETGQ